MEVSGRVKSNRKNGKGDIFCQPCQGDGDNVHAEGFCETCNEYFCTACLKVHRKQSATKTHVIKGKDKMPRVKAQTDPCSELCEVHKTEVVKFFCKEHNSVGCGDCMVLNHKICNVQLVSDISGNYDNKKELKEITQRIEELKKKINASKVEIKKSLKAADEVKARVIKEIKTFRKDMDTYLDNVEEELIKEVEQINVKDDSQQRQLLDECVTMQNELQEFQTNFDQYSDKINKLFVSAKLAQTKLASCQGSVEKIATESQIYLYNFEPCKDMNTLKIVNTPIGRITSKIKNFNVETKKDIVKMKTHYVNEISVKASNECKDCWITGLAMLSSDEILLADYNNTSLKILNVRSNAITSILQLSSPPWDVTVIDSETVATTLPGKGKIVFASTRNGLSESRRLKVGMLCRGIDHRNGVIAVSFSDRHPAVHVMNMTGGILHKVKDTSMFINPNHIAFKDDNNIFVTDYSKNAVYELSIDGQLKATMKGEKLKYPGGFAVTNNGTVLVCCYVKNDSVSMIVPGKSEIKQLSVQHVYNPDTILVCEENSTMYICERSSSANGNFIKVFNLM